MTDTAQQAEHQAGEWRSDVARAGLVGQGILYTLLGLLAVSVALGNRDSASKKGAIEKVAQAPFGKFLLIGLCIALVALVAWKVLQAVAGDPVRGSEATDRAKYALKAVVYLGSTITAITVLVANWSGGSSSGGGGSGGGGGGKQKATSVVMDLPAGRWLVMLAGLGVIGYGCYQIYKQVVNTEFMDRIRSLEHDKEHTVETLGRVGFAGRSGVMIGVGIFLFVAGVNQSSDEVKGLSEILSDLAGQGWGQFVLWILAIGLVAYGLFAFVEARYRRAT